MKGRKLERPLGLDLPFDDALRRFIGTKPAEVAESIEQEKREKASPKVSEATSEEENKAAKRKP